MQRASLLIPAVLLSGCSWLGGIGGNGHNGHANYDGARYAANGVPAPHNCQVLTASQPIPSGCDPAQVTLAIPTQGTSKTQYASTGQFISGGYGSHAHQARQHAETRKPEKRKKKPWLRGTFSFGYEKSVSGDVVDYDDFNPIDPSAGYNPNAFNEGAVLGTPADGSVLTRTYTAVVENVDRPVLDFDDAHSTPLNISAGVELIATPNTTVFANAGYTYAEGNNGPAVGVNATLLRGDSTQAFDTGTLNPLGAPLTANFFVPNVRIANFNYDFSSLERINFEGGLRHYFKPIWNSGSHQAVTPFIAASGGISRYNDLSYEIDQFQLFYERAFESGGNTLDYYQVVPDGFATVDVYDSQWVLQGALQAGIDWQVTPKTALAFETGLRWEEGREYITPGPGGATAKTGDNYSIPFTVRASYNF